ncbi:hypothetical protein VCB98_05840 [Gammaproteobacteria bacterium AB-CW1]|uniref:DUF7931 domain-containing protein n=1 Tax=Natronospira elongata TaxID=3110268 RepID=A0AAP6MJT8_9GAMM|nr:hypothetical protein [Gammaproteobacteria bacterium AB-CW1]
MSDDPQNTGGSLEYRDDSREAARQLAEATRRELLIFTRDLEPAVLDQSEFLEAVRQLVIRSRHTGLRVICQDPTRAIKEGHGLIRLARRVSSHVSLHRPHREDAEEADAFIVSDETGYLYRPLADRLEGRWSPNDPTQARRLRQRFDQMWDRSEPETEFRQLGV